MTINNKIKKSQKKSTPNTKVTSTAKHYIVDIAHLDEDGTFHCPICKTVISPDDETEDAYQILDTKMANHEIAELVIACRTCSTVITLTGFQNLVDL